MRVYESGGAWLESWHDSEAAAVSAARVRNAEEAGLALPWKYVVAKRAASPEVAKL